MMSGPPKVVITGGAGLVGQVLRAGLAPEFDVVAVDRVAAPGVKVIDMARAGIDHDVFVDAVAVVDLAAETGEDVPWDRVLSNNVQATHNALEAARRHGIPRVIYASSNFVTSYYDQQGPYKSILEGDYGDLVPESVEPISTSLPPRPITPYAAGKAMGETLCRYYADVHGLSTFAIRIGTLNAEDRPLKPRHFAKWLSHRDAVALIRACLRCELSANGAFGVYYGVSANRWAIYDANAGRNELNFTARDNAESFR
jgi:uronate dehydrogenase